MGFRKDYMIESRIRLSAANKGALRVLGRTPRIALNLGERNLWMSFLVLENLDESDQFVLGRDFIKNFDVTIDLNNAMFRIRNTGRKYVNKLVNLIMANEKNDPVFLSGRARLKANEAAIVRIWMKNYNELSDNKQECIMPNPNSQSAAFLGRSFSITKRGLCASEGSLESLEKLWDSNEVYQHLSQGSLESSEKVLGQQRSEPTPERRVQRGFRKVRGQ